MPLYFMLFEPGKWERLVPVLATCWSRRSFEPCRALCRDFQPAARSFAQRYHLGPDDLLLAKDIGTIRFDRHLWRTLAGEILLIAADEVPEIETAADTLTCLLAPERYCEGPAPREQFSPIEQVHFGSRDLVFGNAFYRPDHAGWNDRGDVGRLAGYLASIDSSVWQVSDLAELRAATTADDRGEELDYARQCFRALQQLYCRAEEKGQLVVCEEI